MTNFVYLRGIIKNIEYSHQIKDTVFNKADLIVRRPDGREDLIIVKFKEFTLNVREDSEVELIGNVRSFSQQIDGKNKVQIYVFSYFDSIEETYDDTNLVRLCGKVCKKDTLRQTKSGKHYIHYTVANNIITDDGLKLNSYIPCVAWGLQAKEIDSVFNVGDDIAVHGQLQSREYKKRLSDTELEVRMAHEVATCEIEKL